jgi:membrane fusion protein, multidrug efflux system
VTRTAFRYRMPVLLACAAALAVGCSNGKAKDKGKGPAEADSAVPVEVQPLRRAEIVAVHSGTAPIEAHEEAEVVAKVGGEVRQLLVEEGDMVKAGQVLARLDGDRLRLEVAQTDANLRKLERDYNRQLELSEKGLVAKGTAENAKFDLDALRAAYDQRPPRARLHGDPCTDRRRGLGTTHQGRQHHQAANAPDFPRSRTWTRWSHTCTSRKRSSASLPRSQTADVVVDALGGERFTGTDLAHQPDRGPEDRHVPRAGRGAGSHAAPETRHVRARQHRLRAAARTRCNCHAHAIVDADGTQSVFVVADGKAAQRPEIRTGLANNGWIEVTEGLAGDERVVVVGQGGLRTGTAVKVVDAAAPSKAGPS